MTIRMDGEAGADDNDNDDDEDDDDDDEDDDDDVEEDRDALLLPTSIILPKEIVLRTKANNDVTMLFRNSIYYDYDD
ncbi:hypothetical protein M0802_005047 [Mischocyttarus mexicanus]|nr:hypothetical protein M0802_005047 [Mischocyttarus mexicanus]